MQAHRLKTALDERSVEAIALTCCVGEDRFREAGWPWISLDNRSVRDAGNGKGRVCVRGINAAWG